MLGAEHENTLISAKNLAVSLLRCGRQTEVEQLLRNTLITWVRARSDSKADAAFGGASRVASPLSK